MDLLGLRGALTRTVSTSDILVCRSQARPSRPLCRPMRFAETVALRKRFRRLTSEPRALRDAARKGRTCTNPRTPSVVLIPCKPKPAGRILGQTLWESSEDSCTVSPSLGSCAASSALRSFLLASALRAVSGSLDLATEKTRDAFNRRLPLERLSCTRTRAFPARSTTFVVWILKAFGRPET